MWGEETQTESVKVCIASMSSLRECKSMKIGRGGLSECFGCVHMDTGQCFVVKKCQKKEFALKEYSIFKELEHDHIVSAYHLEMDGLNAMILMDYCSGSDFAAFCDEMGAMNERMMAHFLEQIAMTTKYLHHNKVVHGDLKPENIMIDHFGSIKLIDFGSSILMDTLCEHREYDQLRFTPIYAAPELILEAVTLWTAIDVWSIGCILCKMATANDPWSLHKFKNDCSAIFHIANHPQSFPVDFQEVTSPKIRHLLKQCLCRNPQKRITAKQMLKHPFLA